MNYYLLFLFTCIFLINQVRSHGYLADPPARSSAWLFDQDFAKCCTNYNHMEMFCGGTETQWIKNGGNCGICGEDWSLSPKLFEKGGSMYLGKIVRRYTQGESINTTVIVTANHYGWFEFRICNIDGWTSDADQTCLNKTVLRYTNLNDTRLMVKNYSSPAIINFKLDLPPDLTCDHCVLQWKYRCGNRWGIDKSTNQSCMGCGIVQEHFFGCSDIAIKPKINSTLTTDSSINSTKIPTITNLSTTVLFTNSTKKAIIRPTGDDTYNGCRSKLYYGKKIDLSKAVLIYCSEICKTMCNDSSIFYSIDEPEKASICKSTCPALCSCV